MDTSWLLFWICSGFLRGAFASDETTVYQYRAAVAFRSTSAGKSRHSGNDGNGLGQGATTVTANLHVSTLWKTEKTSDQFVLLVQPVGLETVSRHFTDKPFVVQYDKNDIAILHHYSEVDPLSQTLKSGVGRSLSLALNKIEPAAGDWYSPVGNGVSQSTQCPYTGLQTFDLNPIEERHYNSVWTWRVSGNGPAWQSIQINETTVVTVPWTSEPLYTADARATIERTGVTTSPPQVAALRGTSFEETLSKCGEYSSKMPNPAKFRPTDTAALKPPSLKLVDKMKALRKYTLKSYAATVNASRVFLTLHRLIQVSSQEEIVQALEAALKLKKKQKSAINFLVDLIASHPSETSCNAITQVLDFKKKPAHQDLFRRYILASSFAVTPNQEVIVKFMDILEWDKLDAGLQETLALSIGALTYTWTKKASSASTALNSLVASKFSAELSKCNGPEVLNCQVKWLRALGNLAAPDAIPVILDMVKKGQKTGPAAIFALRRYSLKTTDVHAERVQDAIWDVYESSKMVYDSSCKIAALEFLLRADRVNVNTAARLLDQLPLLRSQELQTYVMATLQNRNDKNILRNGLKLAASRNSRVNYANLGAVGQSVVYEGSLLSKERLNATYRLAMEFSAGSMKNTAVGVSLKDKEATFPVITFGLFARGLGSFMGSTDEADALETATAGLSLELLDVSLPSVVFFSGMSELMSLALSAGGSDPVAELQFNLLVQNVRSVNVLYTGQAITTSTLTALSADFSGFVEVSIWGRTFKSLVRNRAALATQTVTNIAPHQTDRMGATLNATELVQGRMDFVTNVDFSGFPVKMCLAMTNSAVNYRRLESQSSAPLDAEPLGHSSRSVIPAKSFYLGVKNTKYCSEMS